MVLTNQNMQTLQHSHVNNPWPKKSSSWRKFCSVQLATALQWLSYNYSNICSLSCRFQVSVVWFATLDKINTNYVQRNFNLQRNFNSVFTAYLCFLFDLILTVQVNNWFNLTVKLPLTWLCKLHQAMCKITALLIWWESCNIYNDKSLKVLLLLNDSVWICSNSTRGMTLKIFI